MEDTLSAATAPPSFHISAEGTFDPAGGGMGGEVLLEVEGSWTALGNRRFKAEVRGSVVCEAAGIHCRDAAGTIEVRLAGVPLPLVRKIPFCEEISLDIRTGECRLMCAQSYVPIENRVPLRVRCKLLRSDELLGSSAVTVGVPALMRLGAWFLLQP